MKADLPEKFVIETTQACVLRCRYCPTGLDIIHRSDLMDWALFTKLADEIEEYVKFVYIEFMGEPTLHPRLGDMIRRVKEFAGIDIATNGVLVTPELAKDIAPCDIISVTLCGLGDVYRQVHGVDRYEDAMAGLRNLRDAKEKPGGMNWTWIVTGINEHQTEKARAMAKEMGVRFHAKSCALAPALARDEGLVPSDPAWNRFDGDQLIYPRPECREFWRVGYTHSDGTVVACGFDWGGIMPLGNLHENSFLEIWNGPEYRRIRQEHLAGNLQPLCRLFCCKRPPGRWGGRE